MIEFEDVGIDMGDGYSAGSFTGEATVNRDGTITNIMLRASKWSKNGWVHSHTYLPRESALFDLISNVVAREYAADIDAWAEKLTHGWSRRVRYGGYGGGSARGDLRSRFVEA